MDQLSAILQRFSMNTEVFFTGNLCGISHFTKEHNRGHIHFLRRGALTIIDEDNQSQLFTEPTVFYFPAPHTHRIIGSDDNPPELVCANIIYNESTSNPIVNALPKSMSFKLSEYEQLNQTAKWLFEEAFHERCGRLPMINSLTNILF